MTHPVPPTRRGGSVDTKNCDSAKIGIRDLASQHIERDVKNCESAKTDYSVRWFGGVWLVGWPFRLPLAAAAPAPSC